MTREEARQSLDQIIAALVKHGIPRNVAISVIHQVIAVVAGRLVALLPQVIDKEMENQWP